MAECTVELQMMNHAPINFASAVIGHISGSCDGEKEYLTKLCDLEQIADHIFDYVNCERRKMSIYKGNNVI